MAGWERRGIATLAVFGFFLSSWMSLPLPARAATFTVTTLSDAPSHAGTSLRDAIAAASSGADTITFQPGLRGPITLEQGTLTLGKSVTVQGPGAGVITVDGNNAAAVFTVSAEVTLSGLTIQHGHDGSLGGGITNLGTLTVTGCTLVSNSGGGGGGIYNFGGTLTVADSTISNNSGGGLGGGLGSSGGTMTVTGSTLSGNSGSSGILNGGTLTLTDSTLSNNGDLGGIINNGMATVTGSIFSGNHGGGIANFGTATVTGSTFSGNSGGNIGGGGILNDGSLTLTDSTLSGNHAATGGGIFNYTGTVTMTNCTLSGNSDIGIATVNGTLTVTNCTITGNSASDRGGGILSIGTLRLRNAIVAGNAAPTDPDIDGVVTVTGHNLIGDTTGSSGITNGVNGDIVTPTPRLGALGDYGGPTRTIPLLLGSPAIGAGDDTVCNATGANNVNGEDQRGIARPQGAHCDIGAFESRGFVLAVGGGNNQSAAAAQPFAQPLAARISSTDHIADLSGTTVTFVPPLSGASAILSSITATTDASGTASVTATANTTLGSYRVAATAPDVNTVLFTLTNIVPTITLSPVLPSGARGVAYPSTTIAVSGTGTAPYTFAVTAGAAPPGLTLSADGTLSGTPSAIGTSTFTVTATDANGFTGMREYTVTVTAAPLVSIAVVPANGTLTVGGSQQYTATGSYADSVMVDITAQVTWTSDNSSIVAVDASGKATGMSPGTAHLTATLGGISGQATVTVSPAPLVSIAVTPANATLKVGSTQQYTATGTYADNSTADLTTQVTWTSDASVVAGVGAGGKATGVSPGTAHIAATLGTVSGQTSVTVQGGTAAGVAPAAVPSGRPGSAGATTPSGAAAPTPKAAPTGR
jgi:uncharacterized protein YjdB